MRDAFVGDIGDYGKYALLRKITKNNLSLAVNWYKVVPSKIGKQNDGKYISYLSMPEKYRSYDSVLFDTLNEIVNIQNNRTIEQIEKTGLLHAVFYSEVLCDNRDLWHQKALNTTKDSQIVFLDPDNGLETQTMHRKKSGKKEHVFWQELKDYYDRGQNVILYQHRPQMMKKEICIANIIDYQNTYLYSDNVKVMEFPQYTNRFYFMFLHHDYENIFQNICNTMESEMNGFCIQHQIDY